MSSPVMTLLADRLKSAFHNAPTQEERYSAAIADSDEAWRAVQGALDSGHVNLFVTAMLDFREAFRRKLVAHRATLPS